MYRDIVETSTDGIWVVDLDGRTLYANTAMGRQLGRSRAEMAHLSMYDVHDEAGRKQLAEHFADLRAGRPDPETVECLLFRGDGSGTWVLLSESLLPADDEGPARVVLHVTDWTDRRHLVDTLSRQQLALAEAERIARIGSWRYDVDTDRLVVSEDLCTAFGLDPAAAPCTRAAFLALVRFWFTAQLQPAAGDDAAEEDRRARAVLTGHRVLVVDDDERNRLILAEQVGWWGLRSETATSVDDALARLDAALAAGGPFELVLLDLAMPDRDGFDLAAAVRSRPELDDVPLVLLSSALPPSRERLRAAGIAACQTKPVLTSTLRGLVLRHLGGVAPAAAHEAREVQRHRVLVVEDNPVNQMVAVGLLDALGYDSQAVADRRDDRLGAHR